MGLDISNIRMLKAGSAINDLFGRRIGGVVHNDLSFRNAMLMRNIGKYGMFDVPLYPEIGSIYNPYEREYVVANDLSGINGILGYTHGIVDQGMLSGSFSEVEDYAGSDFIDGLLSDSKVLSKDFFIRTVRKKISRQPLKVVYSSNGSMHGGGNGKLREAIRKVDEYLASNPYVSSRYKAGWSIDNIGLRTPLINYYTSSEVNEEEESVYYKNGANTTIRVYDEATPNGDANFNNIEAYNTNIELLKADEGDWLSRSILKKTNTLFKDGTIRTILSAFHTRDNQYKFGDDTTTSFDSKYGISRGRNLLKKNPGVNDDPNNTGYDNPYCRVWTTHHQYSTMIDRIRPFNDGESFAGLSAIQKELYGEELRPNKGGERLGSMSVLKRNGMVNVTPFKNDEGLDVSSIKRCMFSIENLAWKDLNVVERTSLNGRPVLPEEQRGPCGGRIMWFPPYGLHFSENINAEWNSNSFIGRGEDIYTYMKTVRGGTLDFMMLTDHPSIVSEWGSNSGDNVSQEEDDDLLRFFAGCQVIADIQEEPAPPINIVEPKTVEPKSIPEPSQIKVMAFFPNNFTGYDMSTDEQVKGAVEYLLAGYSGDTKIADNGYEMRKDQPSTLFEEYRKPGKALNGKATEWCYVVDEQYKGQRLNEANFKDTASYGLNGDEGKDIVKQENTGFDESKIFSFKEFIGALYGATDDSGNKIPGGKLSEPVRSQLFADGDENAVKLMNILDACKEEPEIVCEGVATSHGSGSTSQQVVAKKRGDFAKKLIETVLKYSAGKSVSPGNIKSSGKMAIVTGTSINTLEAKKYRNVCITITIPQPTNINAYNGTTSENLEWEKEGATDNLNVSATTQESASLGYYGDEYRYFRELEEKSPLVYKKILDKVKYFQPAFHSVTPEGFNERLTFLHQCTRQGPTVGSSSMATNLAFGRAPFCVLRIGDFYNAKIAIESISINYDDSTWDMNPEGIGVQPMIAKISLTFKFVGGGDLSGPIERLQNAVSFNYYSNTSVYDPRADYRDKYIDEAGVEVRHWEPVFNDTK